MATTLEPTATFFILFPRPEVGGEQVADFNELSEYNVFCTPGCDECASFRTGSFRGHIIYVKSNSEAVYKKVFQN